MLSWSELMNPGQQEAPVGLQAIPDIVSILNSSAASLTRIGDTLSCILTLFKSQALPPAGGKVLPDKGTAEDEQVSSP